MGSLASNGGEWEWNLFDLVSGIFFGRCIHFLIYQ